MVVWTVDFGLFSVSDFLGVFACSRIACANGPKTPTERKRWVHICCRILYIRAGELEEASQLTMNIYILLFLLAFVAIPVIGK